MSCDMLVKLYELPDKHDRIEALKQKGITIRKPIGPENYAVIAWIRDHFGDGWASEAENAFFRDPKSIYIAIREREAGGSYEMLGFACYDATVKGFFGPTGVDSSLRGSGIGTGLLLACLDAMKEEGYGYAVIGGAGPQEFYRKICGATPIEGAEKGIYKDMLKAEHHH